MQGSVELLNDREEWKKNINWVDFESNKEDLVYTIVYLCYAHFQPPVMIESYKSEVDGTSDGPACPQPVFDNYPVDEDCLRLNVYTPDKLDIFLFYLHGLKQFYWLHVWSSG